jgi:hypothetical protein
MGLIDTYKVLDSEEKIFICKTLEPLSDSSVLARQLISIDDGQKSVVDFVSPTSDNLHPLECRGREKRLEDPIHPTEEGRYIDEILAIE